MTIPLAAFILSATTCLAEDIRGGFTVFGNGNHSCGRYLSEISADQVADLAYASWFAGYITAFNAEVRGVNNVLDRTDIDGALAWIGNYCQQHPTDSFAKAAGKFTAFMQEK
jgi:hypothetical protein